MQDINLYQIKLRVNDTYKKDEKTTTKFEPNKPEGVITKGYLVTEISNVEGLISYIERYYKKLKDLERFNEGVLIEKAVKTTIQILYDKGLFDNYNADEALKDYQLIERRRPKGDPMNDDVVIQ